MPRRRSGVGKASVRRKKEAHQWQCDFGPYLLPSTLSGGKLIRRRLLRDDYLYPAFARRVDYPCSRNARIRIPPSTQAQMLKTSTYTLPGALSVFAATYPTFRLEIVPIDGCARDQCTPARIRLSTSLSAAAERVLHRGVATPHPRALFASDLFKLSLRDCNANVEPLLATSTHPSWAAALPRAEGKAHLAPGLSEGPRPPAPARKPSPEMGFSNSAGAVPSRLRCARVFKPTFAGLHPLPRLPGAARHAQHRHDVRAAAGRRPEAIAAIRGVAGWGDRFGSALGPPGRGFDKMVGIPRCVAAGTLALLSLSPASRTRYAIVSSTPRTPHGTPHRRQETRGRDLFRFAYTASAPAVFANSSRRTVQTGNTADALAPAHFDGFAHPRRPQKPHGPPRGARRREQNHLAPACAPPRAALDARPAYGPACSGSVNDGERRTRRSHALEDEVPRLRGSPWAWPATAILLKLRIHTATPPPPLTAIGTRGPTCSSAAKHETFLAGGTARSRRRRGYGTWGVARRQRHGRRLPPRAFSPSGIDRAKPTPSCTLRLRSRSTPLSTPPLDAALCRPIPAVPRDATVTDMALAEPLDAAFRPRCSLAGHLLAGDIRAARGAVVRAAFHPRASSLVVSRDGEALVDMMLGEPPSAVRALAEPFDAGAAAFRAAHERAVAPRILDDPSSNVLGAAAYGARRPARIRRAGDELVLERLLQPLEAAVALEAAGARGGRPARGWMAWRVWEAVGDQLARTGQLGGDGPDVLMKWIGNETRTGLVPGVKSRSWEQRTPEVATLLRRNAPESIVNTIAGLRGGSRNSHLLQYWIQHRIENLYISWGTRERDDPETGTWRTNSVEQHITALLAARSIHPPPSFPAGPYLAHPPRPPAPPTRSAHQCRTAHLRFGFLPSQTLAQPRPPLAHEEVAPIAHGDGSREGERCTEGDRRIGDTGQRPSAKPGFCRSAVVPVVADLITWWRVVLCSGV
ncbi:hypothetical protein DFH09DRAFT_1281760 [Mycena vulgaris]|nr:hypothetical protein DFH09DRAFT_1281760 [Mycena vulgaris]